MLLEIQAGPHRYRVVSENSTITRVDRQVRENSRVRRVATTYWRPVWFFSRGRPPGRVLAPIVAVVAERGRLRVGTRADVRLIEWYRRWLNNFKPLIPLPKRPRGRPPRTPPSTTAQVGVR
jgi:hypothetical protein